ncbi:hypothetical protein CSIRO_0054 [Bradyrhizobiaceae bacterium SG-6C]|nr:hypothetical protein CSIRO_0054 [Bradyrhizobiaceae bacterium SG-6C]
MRSASVGIQPEIMKPSRSERFVGRRHGIFVDIDRGHG